MSKHTVAVDLDGVLFDIDSYWKDTASKVLKKDTKQVSNDYSFNKRYGLNHADESGVWKAFDWSSIPVYDDAKVSMDILKNNGFEIILVTAINQAIVSEREENLEKEKIYYDDMIVCKSSQEKKSIYNKISANSVIDDLASVIKLASLSTTPSLKKLYYVNRKYSNQVSLKSDCNVSIVNSVSEAVRSIVTHYYI